MIARIVGQQWCVPNGVWYSGDHCGYARIFDGAVAIQTNVGWLLLCNVIQDVETGKVTYEPVKEADLPGVATTWAWSRLTMKSSLRKRGALAYLVGAALGLLGGLLVLAAVGSLWRL